MNNINKKLIFVYNADSSLLAKISDGITKILAPNKYQCNLCMVTYGALSMKEEWRLFLETLPLEKEFLHKDEFKKKYPELSNEPLPAIFEYKDNVVSVIIPATKINNIKSIDELKILLSKYK